MAKAVCAPTARRCGCCLNTTTLKQFRTSGRADIEQYLQYIKDVHKVGRAKCRSVAQACSFFFKRILPAPYIVPSKLYPKNNLSFNIMTEEEVVQLFAAPLTLKEYCVIGLLYGCGLRIGE
ncbi:MAG: hypothetical protein M3Z56_12215 [Bacteroidota bacterium]|nr:hypothetical protein [Bacteroidota bacterium]